MITDEIKQFYDDATFRKLHGFIYTNTRVEYGWQSILNISDNISPKKILEIGSGIGEISFRLATQFPSAQVVGFDISEKLVGIHLNF